MIDFVLEECGPALSLEAITAFEAKYGLVIPQSYRDFLLKYNGGITDKIYYITSSNDLVVSFFMPLSEPSDISIENCIKHLQIELKLMPKFLLPIIEDAFGNTICISCAENDKGAIYFFDHEIPNPYNKIAANFEEFIQNLKEDFDEDI